MTLSQHFSEVPWVLADSAPTWTSDGTDPAIGDGTFNLWFQQIGLTLAFQIEIVMGSTTTFGGANWAFNLGVVLAVRDSDYQPVNWAARDITADAWYSGMAYVNTILAAAALTSLRVDGGATRVGVLTPFTWAVSDKLLVWGQLELATIDDGPVGASNA